MIHLRPHLFRPLAKLKIINDPFYPPFLFFLLERLSCGFFFPNYWDLLSIILFFISTLRHFSAAEATTFSFFLLEWARECLQFAFFFSPAIFLPAFRCHRHRTTLIKIISEKTAKIEFAYFWPVFAVVLLDNANR